MIGYYELLKILVPVFLAMNTFTFWLVRRLVNGFERRTEKLYDTLTKSIEKKEIRSEGEYAKELARIWQAIAKLQDTVMTKEQHELICRK